MAPEQLSIKDFADRFIFVATSRLVYDVTKSPAAEPWSISAFKDYALVYKNEGKPLVNLWLSRKQYRRTVHATAYVPYPVSNDSETLKLRRVVQDPSTNELCYNTYAPPLLDPNYTSDTMKEINVFTEHLEYLMPNRVDREHLIDWWAATVQYPNRRVTWAPLIISVYQGVGKGWMAQLLKKLVGISNYRMITQDQLEGNSAAYNDYLIGSTVVVVDELKAARREDILNRMNSMITETSLEVNAKYGAKGMADIFANFMCFSNHTDALALTTQDRRYWVHILHQMPKSSSYYTKLFNWLETSGPNHLMAFLLKRDITKFSFGSIPSVTLGKDAVVQDNWTELEQVLNSALEDNEGPFVGNVVYTQLILDWVASELRQSVDAFVERDVKAWVRKKGTSLGSRRNMGTRQVLYAVRRGAHYQTQTGATIKDRLDKSITAVHK